MDHGGYVGGGDDWERTMQKIKDQEEEERCVQLRVAAGEADPQGIPRQAGVWNVSDTVSEDSLIFQADTKVMTPQSKS